MYGVIVSFVYALCVVAVHYRLCVHFKPCIVIGVQHANQMPFSFKLDDSVRAFGFGFGLLTTGTPCDTLLPLGTGVSMLWPAA